MKLSSFFRKNIEVHDLEEFLDNGHDYSNATIQNIDFSGAQVNWESLQLSQTVFLGCELSQSEISTIMAKGGVVFPAAKNVPYNAFRSSLYDWQELYKQGKSGKSVDLEIYNHFVSHKYNPSMMEALYQRIHDHAIDDALRDLLVPDENGNMKQKVIGIMGGHGTKRTDPFFVEVAKCARLLGSKGYFIASGGGPGIMEAANLGAYFANYSEADLLDAIQILQTAPHYTNEGFHDTATKVLGKYPKGASSLAIPTWFYGHEPSNVFADQIAKYFSNSIREDTLLAISLHGILFAPGSAGTTQEIFMDAAQNHYQTFEYISPMVFLGRDRYEKDTRLYQTLHELAEGKAYQSKLALCDSASEVVAAFDRLRPEK